MNHHGRRMPRKMSFDSTESMSIKSYDDDSSANMSSLAEQNENMKKDLSRQETLTVLLLRFLVILILVFSALGVSILVYSISTQSDEEVLVTQFYGAAKQLLDNFEAIGTEKILALGSLAVAATAQGIDHGADWPLTSLSSFQERSFNNNLL